MLTEKKNKARPDPVVGVGMVIVGVLVMGVGGAATWHYVFNVGTLVAIVGALVFVINVTISTLRDDKSEPGASTTV